MAIRAAGLDVYRLTDGTLERAVARPDGLSASSAALSADWTMAAVLDYAPQPMTYLMVWSLDGASIRTYDHQPSGSGPPAFDPAGVVDGTYNWAGHTHARDYFFWAVSDVATGTQLRRFPKTRPPA